MTFFKNKHNIYILNQKGGFTLEFFIKGKDFEVTIEGAFSVPTSRRKCKSKHGTILTGVVTLGKVTKGEEVTIFLPNGTCEQDVVSKVEINKKEVSFGTMDDQVGICLKNTRLRIINRALEHAKAGA